jgi:protein TonB
MSRKDKMFNLKLKYKRRIELGLVASLILMIFLMQGFKKVEVRQKKQTANIEAFDVSEIPQTQQQKQAAAPSRPTVPIASEDESLPEDETIDFTDLDLESEPPPPPPPPDQDDDVIVFVPHDEPPVPIGGFDAIQDRLRYPDFARKAGVEGKVLVYALIDVDGTVANTKVMQSLVGCDEAALTAIKAVRWKPGMQRDRPVKVWVMVPVEFRLK